MYARNRCTAITEKPEEIIEKLVQKCWSADAPSLVRNLKNSAAEQVWGSVTYGSCCRYEVFSLHRAGKSVSFRLQNIIIIIIIIIIIMYGGI